MGLIPGASAKLARRQGIKVVLSGLGADELFGGYKSFTLLPHYLRLYRMSAPVRPLLGAAVRRIPQGSRWRRLASFQNASTTTLTAYHVQRGIFTEEEANGLARVLTGRDPKPVTWHVEELPEDPGDCVSYLELTRYMRNQLLRDSDVFSMAHGVELRVPFVDVRLFNSVAAIPSTVRLRRHKRLLLDAVPEVPEWVRNRPKRGFQFPFDEWMEGEFSDLLTTADKTTTVPLVTWYRRWALASVLFKLRDGRPLA